MKSFVIITGVIVSLLVSKFDSKDFCNAFKENDFKIDFTFDFWFWGTDSNPGLFSHLYLIIGSDYWMIERKADKRLFHIPEKYSGVSPAFNSNYSMAFSIPYNTTTLYYGFLNKIDSSIEWIDMTTTGDVKDLSKSSGHIIKKSSNPFEDQDFKPYLSFFGGITIEGRGPNSTWYTRRTFVGQTDQMNGTKIFKRRYVSLVFGDSLEEINPISNGQLVEGKDYFYKIANYSEGDRHVIGVFGLFKLPDEDKWFWVYIFARNKTIEYCYVNGNSSEEMSVDKKCAFDSQLLIDCSTDELTVFWIIAIIVVIIAIIALIICCPLIWKKAELMNKTEEIHSGNGSTTSSDDDKRKTQTKKKSDENQRKPQKSAEKLDSKQTVSTKAENKSKNTKNDSQTSK